MHRAAVRRDRERALTQAHGSLAAIAAVFGGSDGSKAWETFVEDLTADDADGADRK